MNPGELNKKIQIQALTQNVDAYGSVTAAYSTIFFRWAKVRPVRGREPYVNDQRLAEMDLVVSLRYDSDTRTISAKHRILYGSRELEIVGPPINVEEKNKEIRLFCKELA